MRRHRWDSLVTLVFLGAALTGCNCEAPAASTVGSTAASTRSAEPEATPEPETTPEPEAERSASLMTECPSCLPTPSERAARAAGLTDDERERIRSRARFLREGRRLAHAGDHVGALAAFQSGLALDPTDATLACEAGLQAHEVGDLALATELLELGSAHALRPSTEGACLYNLGRVREASGNLEGAATVYAASLEARENGVVAARLRAVVAELGPEAALERGITLWDESEGLSVGFPNVPSSARFDTLEALAAALTGELTCLDFGTPRWVPETDTPALHEASLVWIESSQDLISKGYLVVRGDPGWRVAGEILERDSTDTYGRLEAWENVASVTFADDIVEVHITGHYDESEGESELYFQCEDENPGDDAAAQACFEERQADLSPPEHWERTVSFRVSLGGIADF